MSKSIEINNKYLLKTFVHEVCGLPWTFDSGRKLFGGRKFTVKCYQGFDIKSRENKSGKRYAEKIIFKGLNQHERKKPTHIAESKKLPFSNIEKIIKHKKEHKIKWHH